MKRFQNLKAIGFCLAFFLLLPFFLNFCSHTPASLPEPEKQSRIFDMKEDIILRAVNYVLKDRGFPDIQVDKEKGMIQSGYLIQENWRFKVEGEIKKFGKRERELTLLLSTEEKSSSGWKARKILGPQQYEKLFDEIEMQIYRELSKGN